MATPMIVLILFALPLLAIACIRRIPAGQVYALRRVGGQMRIVGAGMHLVLPLIERVARKINLAGSTLAVDEPGQDAITHVRGVIYFQVLDPARAGSIPGDPEQMLRATLKRLAADAALPEAADARRCWLKQELNAEMRAQGLLIARVDLAAQA